MKPLISAALMLVVCASFAGPGFAGDNSKKGSAKDVKTLTHDEQMKLAMSAGPPQISKDATIMVFGPEGKLVEARKGTNGFTCIPTISHGPIPDPICMDAAVNQWMTDVMNKAPKPSNTVPGISFMARGGMHWEKDGQILMEEQPGAKVVKEPPHWMVMWPFDSKTSMLPTAPNPSGVWVMFDGTPYAHLMIYQDPKKMNK
jgi:hypothetical protein